MPQAYTSPTAASTGLTAAFSPTTDAQKTAIANAAALVPNQTIPGSQPYSPTYDSSNNITGYKGASVQPTVLSSSSIDTKNQDNTAKVSALPTPGQNVGTTGFVHNADQSFAEAPSTATQVQDESGNTVWKDNGMTYAMGPAGGNISSDPATQALYEQFSSLKGQMDAAGAQQIENIKQQYESLIKQQGQVNAGAQAGTYSMLARGGSLQTESSGGIIQSQISYGLGQIADLTNKENSAVNAAQMAMQDNDFKLLDKQLSIVSDARKQKQDAAQKLNDVLITQQENMKEQQAQASKDSAISAAMEKLGTTDPSAIFSELQKNGNTTINSKDVSNALTNLASNTGASLDKLSGDTKDFYMLQKNGLLPNGVDSLGKYISYVNNAKQTPQTPAAALAASLNIQQKGLAIQRTSQLIESAKALEASRLVSSQIKSDKAIQNFLQVSPLMGKLKADVIDVGQNGINQSNAASILDAITQINTGGKVITEGQVSLTKDSQSYIDKAKVMLNKIEGKGGVIDEKIIKDIYDLAKNTNDLYTGQFKQHADLYANRLKNVNGQDLREYSPLTDISNLPNVLSGTYEQALSGSANDASTQLSQLNAQGLLDNPPPEVAGTGSYDPSMWVTK